MHNKYPLLELRHALHKTQRCSVSQHKWWIAKTLVLCGSSETHKYRHSIEDSVIDGASALIQSERDLYNDYGCSYRRRSGYDGTRERYGEQRWRDEQRNE